MSAIYFAMAILVTSPRLLSGDVLLFFRRVTRYDHFCAFQFFSILAVSMATASILKKLTLTSTTSHGI
jgi:uroporphyrinogen-III synthase